MRPEVCVGAIVLNNDQLLMIRRGTPPELGFWTVPGGRVEDDEFLEMAVIREVQEETGLEVVCDRFVDWVELIGDDYHFLVMDFLCQLVGEPDVVAGDDAAEARWVPLHEVGELHLVEGMAEFLHTNGIIETIA